MRVRVFFCLSVAVILLGVALTAHTDVPQLINYQGVLLDSGGNPVTSPVSVIFTIYDDATVGVALWAETRTVSPGANGSFSIMLGEVEPIVDTIFSGADRWLATRVEPDPEMTPRSRLVSAGYAYRTSTVDGATGGIISGALTLPGDGGDTLILDPLQIVIRGAGGDQEAVYAASGMTYTGTGDALTVYDSDGDIRVTISVDEDGGAITLFESSATQLPGQPNQGGRKVEFREGGVLLYGASDADTVCHLLPDGSIIGRGQLTMGENSSAGGDWATVLGYNNTADGDSATVSGGYDNHASGYASTISGGARNDADSAYSTIGGGFGNTASGRAATVAGGIGNTADNSNATVGGGTSNTVNGSNSTIAGGMTNTADGGSSAIGGGGFNNTVGVGSAIAGGWYNLTEAKHSFVGGGEYNKARGNYSVICGGGGGEVDSNSALGSYTAIGGGRGNNIGNYTGSTIGGGWKNTIDESYAVIDGGSNNSISAMKSIIAGGELNSISGPLSAINGGRNQTITAGYSSIAGGSDSHIDGQYSAVVGGLRDTLSSDADFCLAFGNELYLNNSYRVAFFDGTNHGRLGLNRDDRDGGINHPIHVGTDGSNGNGAYLTAGGTWTNGSSRTFKENFQPVDSEELLAKIAALSVESWNYKGTTERHIGPVAEDFVGAFDVGTTLEDGTRDNKYLSHGDIAGVALLAIQELDRRTQIIEQLERELAEVKAMLQKILAERP